MEGKAERAAAKDEWIDARPEMPAKFRATISGIECAIEQHKFGGSSYWEWSIRLPKSQSPEMIAGIVSGSVRSMASAKKWAEQAAKYAALVGGER